MIKTAVLLAFCAASVYGASWTGEISDSACGTSHAKMMGEHKDLKTDRDCTLACVKAGSKYVLVSDGKVFQIENRESPALQQRAGRDRLMLRAIARATALSSPRLVRWAGRKK